MKIRTGFVSNSSSSSFLIYGVSIEKDEFLDKLNIDSDTEEHEDFDVWELYDDVAGELGMDYHSPYDWDEVFIGASWDSIGDDETGAQFKERITKKLKEKFGDDIIVSTYSEAWHD